MGGFAGQLGVANNFTAELVALLQGLDFAWSKGVSDIIYYSDYTSVIMAVLQSVAPAHSHAGLICSIQDRLCRPWRVQLRHTLREGNKCANWLAREGVQQLLPLVIVDAPPRALGYLLMADRMRVMYPRGD